MTRLNVYLPDGLAARLAGARRRGRRVNVSALLRAALEAHLGGPPNGEAPA